MSFDFVWLCDECGWQGQEGETENIETEGGGIKPYRCPVCGGHCADVSDETPDWEDSRSWDEDGQWFDEGEE